MVPGTGLVPFLPSREDDVPDVDLKLRDVVADPADVAAYARVCGFGVRATLPPTYPHILAFPLHMAVMTDPAFPFGVVGLVHVENQITQHRPIALGEELAIRVHATKLRPHPKGRAVTLVTEVRTSDGELVWEELSTNLRIGEGNGAKTPRDDRPAPPVEAAWSVPGDIGRRYAAVSGDRNPIHLHPLTAKAFGFPRAIAHGMWTKARVLGALGSRVPDAFRVDVRFARPLLLPAPVELATAAEGEAAIRFAVRSARDETVHLTGELKGL
jgi:acyl dehydratase